MTLAPSRHVHRLWTTASRWLSRPVAPGETAADHLASVTLHRILRFAFLIALPVVLIRVVADPQAALVTAWSLVVLIGLHATHHLFGTKAGFAALCAAAIVSALTSIEQTGGIYSPTMFALLTMTLGTAVVFPVAITYSGLGMLLVASAGLAIAQQPGVRWLVPTLPPPASLWWMIATSTVNFYARVVSGIEVFREQGAALQDKAHALERTMSEQAALLQAEKQLFWDISHELRSPLVRIDLCLRSAAREGAGRSTAGLPDSEHHAEQLSRQVQQLLTLAQVQHQIEFPRGDTVDLASLLDEIAIHADFEAGGDSTRIRLVIQPLEPIRGSAELLRCAFDALIRNALAHAPGGTPVEVTLARTEAGGACVTVSDRGPEAPVHLLPQVFEGVFDPDSRPERWREGTGLGLALAKAAALLHGGGIRAVNRPSGGFEVVVTLPPQALLSRPPSAPGAALREWPMTSAASDSRSMTRAAAPGPSVFDQLASDSLQRFTVFMMFWGVAWTLVSGLMFGRPIAASAGVGLSIVLAALVSRELQRRVSVRAGYAGLYVTSTLIALVVMLYGGGLYNPATYTLITVILAGAVAFRKRTVFWALGLLMLAYIVVTFAHGDATVAPAQGPLTPVLAWLAFLGNGGAVGLVLLPAIGAHKRTQAELEENVAALAAATAESQRLLESQRRLFVGISRELSPGLKQLRASLHQLQDRAGEAARAMVSHAQTEATRLEQLLRELSILGDTRHADERAAQEIVDLSAVAREVCADADFEAQQSGRHVELRTDDAVHVYGRRDRLRTAIENVVRNAVRHTARRTIVDVTVSHAPAGECHVTVADHGPGVPEPDLDRIFAPFVRLAPSVPQGDRAPGISGSSDPGSPSGSGLGLAIARGTIESLGGRITASPRPGGGLVITITLPAIEPPRT